MKYQWIAYPLIGACLIASPNKILTTEEVQVDLCAKELLLAYFPAPIVKETLKNFNIDREKWASILEILSKKDGDIVKSVEEKAAKMDPNPLKDPQKRLVAVKLFKDTLLEAFTEAMRANGFKDTTKFQAMLEDIQKQKIKMFSMCMDKQKMKGDKKE